MTHYSRFVDIFPAENNIHVHDLLTFQQITVVSKAKGATLFVCDLQVGKTPTQKWEFAVMKLLAGFEIVASFHSDNQLQSFTIKQTGIFRIRQIQLFAPKLPICYIYIYIFFLQ